MIKIVKIPFDKCIVERKRRGAAKAPDIIEQEFQDFFEFELLKDKIELTEAKELDDFEKMQAELEEKALQGHSKGELVVGLGGDHSVSYGLCRAFAKKFPNSGLIWFDAHLDCQDDFFPPTHEDVLRAIVNAKLFKEILVIGARNYTQKEIQFIEKNKIALIPASQFYTSELFKNTLGQLEDFTSKVPSIYVSIDIDAIDPAFAPGTGWQEPAGLLPQRFLYLLGHLKASKKVKGLDLVEVCPQKDISNMTSRLAAKILLDFIK